MLRAAFVLPSVLVVVTQLGCNDGFTPVGSDGSSNAEAEDGASGAGTDGGSTDTTGDTTGDGDGDGDGDGTTGDGDGDGDGDGGDGDGDGTSSGDGDGDGTGDGDGDGDVCGDGLVGVGEFCMPTIDSTFPGAFRAFGDFDGDGIDDWVGVGDQGADAGFLFVAGGPGFDTSAATFSAICSTECNHAGFGLAHATDLDGDSNLDLVITAMPATGQWPFIWSALGNGDGTFGPAVSRTTSSGAVNTSGLGDVTGDGSPDLLLPLVELGGGFFLGRVNIFPGAGDGTFASPVVLEANRSQRAATAVDLDGDNDVDILGAGVGGVISLWENDGTGTFGAVVDVPLSMTLDLDDLVPVHLDGDGRLDLVARQVSAFSAWSHFGTAGGGWFTEHVFQMTSSSRFVFPDLDADGDADMAYHDGSAFRALFSVAGPLDTTRYMGDAVFTDNVPVGMGDFNGDGAPDVGAAEHVMLSTP